MRIVQRTSQRAAATARKRDADYEYDPEPGERSPSPASGARVSVSRLSTEDRRFGAWQPNSECLPMRKLSKPVVRCCGFMR